MKNKPAARSSSKQSQNQNGISNINLCHLRKATWCQLQEIMIVLIQLKSLDDDLGKQVKERALETGGSQVNLARRFSLFVIPLDRSKLKERFHLTILIQGLR